MKKRSAEKMWDRKVYEVDPTNKPRLVKIPVEILRLLELNKIVARQSSVKIVFFFGLWDENDESVDSVIFAKNGDETPVSWFLTKIGCLI